MGAQRYGIAGSCAALLLAGGAALHAAAAAGSRDAERAWIAAGAPVNPIGNAGGPSRNTALAEAIQRRDLAMIADLEAAGVLEWPDD